MTRVCDRYGSPSCRAVRRWLLSYVAGLAEPNDTETEKEKGEKEVRTPADRTDVDDVIGPRAKGMRPKTRSGTASHKREAKDCGVDLSRASAFLAHCAVIFSRSLTLVADRSAYFSSSDTGKTQASHQGNCAGSEGISP